MTERPIIFSGPLVRAILDGRKSQTRRVLKPQPTFIEASGRWEWPLPKRVHRPGCCTAVYSASREWHQYAPDGSWPYAVGDRLWVRETWSFPEINKIGGPVHVYRADGERDDVKRWCPSIHMPKWAARIWLTVTGVRVQRLQDINEEDARAEGARPAFTRTTQPDWPVVSQPSYVWGFEELWDSIHGPGAFERNDWVAAISFEKAS